MRKTGPVNDTFWHGAVKRLGNVRDKADETATLALAGTAGFADSARRECFVSPGKALHVAVSYNDQRSVGEVAGIAPE